MEYFALREQLNSNPNYATLNSKYQLMLQRRDRMQMAKTYMGDQVALTLLTAADALTFLNDLKLTGTGITAQLEERYLAGFNQLVDFVNGTGAFTAATGFASKAYGTGANGAARKAMLKIILED